MRALDATTLSELRPSQNYFGKRDNLKMSWHKIRHLGFADVPSSFLQPPKRLKRTSSRQHSVGRLVDDRPDATASHVPKLFLQYSHKTVSTVIVCDYVRDRACSSRV